MRIFNRLIIFSVFSFYSSFSIADQVTEAINQAIGHYKKNELSEATAQLDYAASLIRQQQLEQIKAAFPDPLNGWEIESTEGEAAGAAMFGGGINATRRYLLNDEVAVSIELTVDSPMIQSIMALVSNPSMITMSGAKLIQVQGRKAMLKTENGESEITIVMNNKAMILVRGEGASLDQVKAYAETIRFDKIK